MDAIVFENNNITIKPFNFPEIIAPDEVLIKVRAVGLCKTDLLISNGELACNEGQILGHEFSGVIEKFGGNVVSFKKGDKVAINPVIFCKECRLCLSKANNCANYQILGINLNGALTEFIKVPSENIYKIPDKISFEVSAYLEPLAAALSMLNVDFSVKNKILIFGSGRIAGLSSLILKIKGFLNVKLAESLEDLSCDETFDVVIENGINNDIFNKLIDKLNISGTFILKSRHLNDLSFNGAKIIKKELKIIGANYAGFESAYKFLIENHQALNDFIGNSYPFSDYKTAFANSLKDSKYKNFIILD